jgi:hypothetical protein
VRVPGDVQGDPVELDVEVAGFIAYALNQQGCRLYSRAALVRAKGCARSELAGFIGLFEGRGHARFAGWAEGGEIFQWRDFTYTYSSGEPMGLLITYPYIRCLATEESQAGNTYDVIHLNLSQGPLGEDLPGEAAGLTRILLPEGDEIIPSTAKLVCSWTI